MKIYRARVILPIAGPPIENGAVAVDESVIVAVGRWDEIRRNGGVVEDLGEVTLLPGLINAHCHLDYTLMRGAIFSTGSFSGWVRRLNELKRALDDDDYVRSIAAGFAELIRWGCTSVFNIESLPELMVRMPPPPIRTWWFYELLDIRTRVHTEDVVAGALSFFEHHSGWLGGFGLSPHAPYTTSLHLYKLIRSCAEEYGMPVCTHLAESDEEFDMFARGTGALYQFLKSLGRDMSDAGCSTPVEHLLDADVLPGRSMLVHMNLLGPQDEALLAKKNNDFTIVHCPNCHAYFRRPPFPYEVYQRIGIPVCLGTDSCASNTALNLFSEMQCFIRNFPSVPPEEVLRMVTTIPARAIGMRDQLGELRAGALADLICVPWTGSARYAVEAVIANTKAVNWTMVGGWPVTLP